MQINELIRKRDLLKRGKWCDCFIRNFLPEHTYQIYPCRIFKSIGFPAYQWADVQKAEARHRKDFKSKHRGHVCPLPAAIEDNEEN